MRKLKCTDCGGTLNATVNDEGMAIGTCGYCAAEYLLDRQRKKYVIVEHRFQGQPLLETGDRVTTTAWPLWLWGGLTLGGICLYFLTMIVPQQSRTEITDQNSSVVFNVGGQGSGPGQFRENANLIGIDALGQSIVMDDGRMHIFASDGRFIKSSPPFDEIRNADPLVVLPNGDLILFESNERQLVRFNVQNGQVTERDAIKVNDAYIRENWLAFATPDGGFATYQRQDTDFINPSSVPQSDLVVFYDADLREKRTLRDLISQAVASDPLVQEAPVVTDFVVNGAGSIFLNLLAREDSDSRGGIYEFNADGQFQRRIVIEHGFYGDLALGADGAIWYSDPWLNFLQRIDGPEIAQYDLSALSFETGEPIGLPNEIMTFPNGDVGVTTGADRLVRIEIDDR